ncbi:MAG: discoidin domain-containing protein [Armatimonadia bacterium]
MRKILLLSLIVVIGSAAAAAPYDLLRSVCTGPTILSLPWVGAGAPRVYMRAEKGKWVPAKFSSEGGRLTFQLNPAELGSGNIMLIIDPPAGLTLDDVKSPVFADVCIDGKSVKAGATVDLGKVKTAPGQVQATVKDADNALDTAGVRVMLDQETLAAKSWQVRKVNPKQAQVEIRLPQMEYGPHELVVTAVDIAPEPNEGSLRVAFNLLDFGNLALASMGAKISVSDSFGGYESVTPINDGVTTMPGDSCGPDISWASAEVDSDHWAEVTLPKPEEIKEVSVYWAAYTHVTHTPKHFEVQVPEGAGWNTVYASPAEGEKVSTVSTARFAPVEVSRFRIFMPKGQGSISRPNLLWIGEIKAR